MYVAYTDDLIFEATHAEIFANFNSTLDGIEGVKIAPATDFLTDLIWEGYEVIRWWLTDSGYVDGETW